VFNSGERVKPEASAEVVNLFTVYGAPHFLGPVSQNVGDHVGSHANPTFDTPNFVASARQIQPAVRLNF
jgi:hypothetical protein